MNRPSSFQSSDVVARTAAVAREVAAKHADAVDRDARFPSETFAALREARLLSAAVPKDFGGQGAGMLELGNQCAALAQGCSSSGMVLAMHHIQVACIARHGANSAYFQKYLRENLAGNQELVASITSENGTFGDTRSSICAVEVDGDAMKLDKDATTVSYGAHADAQLVTCRRAADAANSDQVLVLFPKGSYTLEQTGTWDTLGMRGTCSPGAKFSGHGTPDQIVPGSFADSSAQTMVPYSHILWSALWTGIASRRGRPRRHLRARRGAAQARQRAAQRRRPRARLRRPADDAQQLASLCDRVRRDDGGRRCGRARNAGFDGLGAQDESTEDRLLGSGSPAGASGAADHRHPWLQERLAVQRRTPLP